MFATEKRRDENERERAAFYRRMQAAACCPIPGPCFECADRVPHHCPLSSILRWEPDPKEALALALDAVIYADSFEDPLDATVAAEILLGRLCQEHRRLASALLPRRTRHLRQSLEERRSG